MVITFVFGAFYLWGNVKKGADTVAVVDGAEISARELARAQRQVEERLRSQFGGELDQTLLSALDAPKLALDSLIQKELELSAAREMGLFISKEELASTIEATSGFAIDGKFDPKKYFDLLSLNSLTPKEYEHNLKQSLMAQKLRAILERSAAVTDEEAYARLMFENEEVVLKYARVDIASLETKVKVDEEDLKKWYKDNEKQFLKPEQRSFRTLSVKRSDFLSEPEITDQMAEEYYAANIDRYEIKERVRASHILLKNDPHAGDEQIAKRKEDAEKIWEKAIAGEDFASLAKEYSEGPTKDKGGDLGYFEKGSMVKPFEDKAFSMKPGEISKPLLTQFGWHIIKVVAKDERRIPTLEELRGRVDSELRIELAEKAAYEFMADLEEKVTSENFAAQSDIDSKIAVNSRTMNKGEISTEPDGETELLNEVFSLEAKTISHPIKTSSGYQIVVVDAITAPVASPLPEVREKVEALYRKEKAREMAQIVAERIEKSVNEGKTLVDVAKEESVIVEKSPPFSRKSFSSPKNSNAVGVLREGFELSDGEASSVPVSEGFLVITMLEKRAPVIEDKKKEMANIKLQILNRRRLKLYEDFIMALRKKAIDEGRIQIYKEGIT